MIPLRVLRAAALVVAGLIGAGALAPSPAAAQVGPALAALAEIQEKRLEAERLAAERRRAEAQAAAGGPIALLAPSTAPAQTAAPRDPAPQRDPAANQIVVVTRPMRAGERLTEADLAYAPRRGAARGALRDIAEAIGLETRTSLFEGRALRASDLTAPMVVRRNQVVTVEFRRGPLLIRTEGRALEPGAIGDSVRILNLDSRRTIYATVSGPATVETR